MGLNAMIWAFKTPVSNVGAKFVLLALAEHASNKKGITWKCFPSVKRLASFTSQSERTVERHLAWLIANGWVTRQQRQRGGRREGVYVYTLRPDKMAGDTFSSTRQNDADQGTVCPETPDKMAVLSKKEPVSEPITESDQVGDDGGFEAWWAEYPLKVEKLGAKAAYHRIVGKGLASAEELIVGARSYAGRVRDRDRCMVKHPTRWLNLGCWADDASPTRLRLVEAADGRSLNFDGPVDLWGSIVAMKGEAWAMSWVAPCRWEAQGMTLLARTELAASRIRQEVGATLRALGVGIGVAGPGANVPARVAPNDLRVSEGVVSTPSLRSGAGACL